MVTVTTTWTGPADKLLIDGEWYRYHWTDREKEREWMLSQPGRISMPIDDMSVPGKITRVSTFESAEYTTPNALQRPISIFKNGMDGRKEEGKYMRDNGITATEVIS